ncbi:hypothetical protein SPRA44_260123 [Serratia proteamaculans]|nr:hypothetical protein SPRA44_260123 [Serratia proteamaculans]
MMFINNTIAPLFIMVYGGYWAGNVS